jgi:prepilin-type N-terminal cleavage/methylation domain-containing protein/prepilin-type processing-associated H-X9-DG protein
MKTLNPNPYPPSRHRAAGFTLIELLVVIAIIAILASMILPSLSKAKQKTQGVYCMNNTRQLMIAWSMYAHDAGDKLVPSFHGGNAQGGISILPSARGGSKVGWIGLAALITPTSTSSSMRSGPGWDLMLGSPRTFSNAQPIPSWEAHSALWGGKSVAEACRATLELGKATPRTVRGTQPIGISRSIHSSPIPGPMGPGYSWMNTLTASTTPAFLIPTPGPGLICQAPIHNGACGFAFADGHAEIHKWKQSAASPRALAVKFTNGGDMPGLMAPKAGDIDIRWMNFHGGRNTPNTF